MRRNLGLIFAGLLFFALPNFNLLDIVPDFIGALLIMAGLSKMYMYDGNFEDARRAAKFLFWISVLRLVLCFWATSGGRRDYLVPFTFIICVLEAIYMISLFKGLYAGLEYTLMRADSERLVKKTSDAFTMSFIFVIVSRLLEFAPEICEIYAQDAELDLSAGASFKMSMAQMKMYVLGVCLICGLILGIIFIIVTANTWIRVIADKNYAPFLEAKYREYSQNYREEYLAIKISAVYFLFTLSFVFFFDFFIDGINIIPSFVGVLLMGAAAIYLSVILKKGVYLSVIITLSAFAGTLVSYAFMNRVHLGINYLCSLESYNYKEFALLGDSRAIYISVALAVVEFILCLALVIYTASQMISLFSKERRTVAIPMLKILCVPSALTFLSSAALKVFKTIEGHLTTNASVMEYVTNKHRITNQRDYLDFLENPLVARYEQISSVSYGLTLATIILCIICVVYLTRIRRFTDGDCEKK